ncbi:MAG TPA: multidrug ABC transporter ATP-binding protein, partial [Ruminiclostridium sp.]|nr:multidrug ABC transporter ATP-binding protein [Ruminiclostridium sp.]
MPGPMIKAVMKPKDAGKTLGRILKYMSEYRLKLIIIAIAIIISAFAGVAGTYFLKPVINQYIVPFIGQKNPDFSGFISMLTMMGTIYVFGILATFTYSKLMVNIATSTLKKIRVNLFTHMESLPIGYFDAHTHGELMSRYTNDIDTLREMISQSIPNLFSSALSVIGVFVMMLVLSPVLTILVVLMLILMLYIIKTIGSKSGMYFMKQQKEIGKVNGYIEEMIEGQKVIKVFCHEDAIIDNFEKLNDELCDASTNAHTFANILMPIMGNLSYLQYAITAAVGGVMAIRGLIDLGAIASFLQYTRSFSQPITQISQQMNSILSALAGAERIFEVLDEKPEEDQGTVVLARVKKNVNGELIETESGDGILAWKVPHKDGSPSYTVVKGDVRFQDVTFGYEENKTVLRNITLYAKPGQKIAFVGSTGAGKTTITNLINRFYDVPDGKIQYDGINI